MRKSSLISGLPVDDDDDENAVNNDHAATGDDDDDDDVNASSGKILHLQNLLDRIQLEHRVATSITREWPFFLAFILLLTTMTIEKNSSAMLEISQTLDSQFQYQEALQVSTLQNIHDWFVNVGNNIDSFNPVKTPGSLTVYAIYPIMLLSRRKLKRCSDPFALDYQINFPKYYQSSLQWTESVGSGINAAETRSSSSLSCTSITAGDDDELRKNCLTDEQVSKYSALVQDCLQLCMEPDIEIPYEMTCPTKNLFDFSTINNKRTSVAGGTILNTVVNYKGKTALGFHGLAKTTFTGFVSDDWLSLATSSLILRLAVYSPFAEIITFLQVSFTQSVSGIITPTVNLSIFRCMSYSQSFMLWLVISFITCGMSFITFLRDGQRLLRSRKWFGGQTVKLGFSTILLAVSIARVVLHLAVNNLFSVIEDLHQYRLTDESSSMQGY
jgi:hypothetical protein